MMLLPEVSVSATTVFGSQRFIISFSLPMELRDAYPERAQSSKNDDAVLDAANYICAIQTWAKARNSGPKESAK